MRKHLRVILLILVAVLLAAAMALLRVAFNLPGSGVGVYYYAHSELYTAGPVDVAEPVTKLDIDWQMGTVTIREGDTLSVTETCELPLSEATAMHWRFDKGELSLRYTGSDVDLSKHLVKHLVITVPAGVNALEVNGISPDMDIAAAFDRVELQTLSGNIIYVASVLPSEMSIDVVSGSIDLFAPADAAFSIRFKTESGSMDCALPCRVDGKLYAVNGGGPEYKLDVASGAVRVSALP